MKQKINLPPTGIAARYEQAWNFVVENLSAYKKDIIINNFPYDNRVDKDVSDEVSREVAKLAESEGWEPPVDDGNELRPRRRADNALHQLVVDDVVNPSPVRLVRHDHFEPPGFETTAIKLGFHRIPGSEQADSIERSIHNGGRRRVSEMNKLDVNGRGDVIRHDVHRVRAENNDVSSSILKMNGISRQQIACGAPISRRLQCLNTREVVAANDEIG